MSADFMQPVTVWSNPDCAGAFLFNQNRERTKDPEQIKKGVNIS
jgi:hypothetical protein